jgi:hypothetical protein
MGTLLIIRDELPMPDWNFALFMGGGLVFIVSFGIGSQKSALEPEPLAPEDSSAVAKTYNSLRHLKGWGFYSLGVAGMLVVTIPPLLIAWDHEHLLRIAIALGAGGGTIVGIAGGVVGILADSKRARINDMLCHTEREKSA